MSKKHKNVYRVLNYIEQLLILLFTNTGCVYIPAFSSLFGILTEITSSVIGLEICVLTAGITKYKSIIKKKKTKHENLLWLTKSKLNSVEILIFMALID